ncbi:uncharacterized protein KQ657_004378 [Scheffersomyces spartinae]|uniref:Zn(2)-C6 fungal-type domain-containing protein n=1 Tax=Scheffersomyces spartinae TaxID=45513 RepID=A0A9P8AJF3_9ASCO|nr:uncharacterized protein KQ657_004378 [Scheffersomyces spartinae]KAG7194701.1 hypothetical protein KQ657_004378 [Scheffersomyces spartinae]
MRCLTCRQRKKKCDELLYPVCQNCLGKNLECRWSRQILDLHNKLKQVKYVGKSKSPLPIEHMTKEKQNISPSISTKTASEILSYTTTPSTSSVLTPIVATLDEDLMPTYSNITYSNISSGYLWDDIDSSQALLAPSLIEYSNSPIGESLRQSSIQVVKPQYESTKRKKPSRIIDKIAYQEDVTNEGNAPLE